MSLKTIARFSAIDTGILPAKCLIYVQGLLFYFVCAIE